MTRIPKLAGLAEIAGLAGVSRQRAGQLTAHPEFPKPVQRLAMGPVWVEADVTAFLAVERKPGRRKKITPEPQATGPGRHPPCARLAGTQPHLVVAAHEETGLTGDHIAQAREWLDSLRADGDWSP